jgi:hypothetical protein
MIERVARRAGFVRTGLYARSMERLRNKGDGVAAAIGADANRNADCLPLVRAVVAAGLYPNIARIESRAGFLTSAAQSNAANAHGSHQVCVSVCVCQRVTLGERGATAAQRVTHPGARGAHTLQGEGETTC